MAPFTEFGHDRLRDARFGLDGAAGGHARLAGRRGRADMLDTGVFAGLLHVHAEIKQIDQDLHVSLRLHVAAHDAEHELGFAVLGDHRRDDRVERALARFEAVGVVFVQ